MATQPEQKEAHELAKQVRPLRQFAARRAGAGGVRPRAGADARPRSISPSTISEHVAPAVLRHRIILNFDAHADGQTPETILSSHHQRGDRAGRRVGCLCHPLPLLDREFLEKLERLTIHWQKSFAGLVGGHNRSRFAGRRPGVSRPSQFPPGRRSARRELARLHAAGEAVPEDVPGGAARAGAHAARHQRLHARARRAEVRLSRGSWPRRSATSGWCGSTPSRFRASRAGCPGASSAPADGIASPA